MNKLILLGILALFSTTIILTQTIFSQTIENEIIANTLETVEKATLDSLEITESFQLENFTTNLNKDTESAIAGAGQTSL